MTSGSETVLLNFFVTPEQRERLDEYRFRHRFLSRAAAVKFLLAYALDEDPTPDKLDKGPPDKPTRKARKTKS